MTSLRIEQLRSTLATQWRRLRGAGVGAVLLRGATIFLAIQVVGTGLNFLLHVMLARDLGAEQYGHYAYVLSWVVTLVVLPKLGLDVAVMAFLPVYVDRKEWGLLRGLLHTSSIATVAASFAVSAIAIAAISQLGVFEDSSLRATFWAGMAIIPIQTLSFVWASALRGMKRVGSSQVPLGVLYPLILVIGVLIWHRLVTTPLYSATAMWMTFASSGVVLVILGMNLWSALPVGARVAAPERALPEWRGAAVPLLVMSLLQILAARGGILIMGAFLGTTEAGIYFSADRLATLMALGAVAINSWAAPLIAELYGAGRSKELQRLVHVGTRGLVAYSVPLAVLLIAFGHRALGLFGPEFPRAYPALVILVVGQLAAAFVGPAGFLPTMTGHQQAASWVAAAMTVLNLGLSLVMIPTLGITGAAVASAVSLVVRSLAMAILAWRTVGIRSSVY